MLGHVPRQSHPLVRGALKQVFAAVDRDMAAQVAAGVIAQLTTVAPKVARLLGDAEEDLLAYMRLPREHWPKIRSTNPLERVNREIARRSNVVALPIAATKGTSPIEGSGIATKEHPSLEA